jgi:hypothetical protein
VGILGKEQVRGTMTTPEREPRNIPVFPQRDLPDVDTSTDGPDEIVLPDETTEQTTESDGKHRSSRESNETTVR